MDMAIVWDKIMPFQFFRKMSLTRQVLVLILLFLLFFCFFFSIVIKGNIESTISTQMYNMMAARQEPILSLLKIDSSILDEDMVLKLHSDSYQSNCIVSKDSIQVLDFSQDIDQAQRVYAQVFKISKDLLNDPTQDQSQGVFTLDTKKFYYHLSKIDDSRVLASFMDDTYPQSFRNSLIDSTVYMTILAFCTMLLLLMAWVFSIIHPLNQIRTYIEQVKQGKDVSLRLNREDEIGEVAHALVVMREEVTRQEKIKEEMIHNISHDLKTPIATIKSYSESIKDGIYPYGNLESSVDVILDNAQRLEDKVHNLLYLNRVEYLLTSDAEGVVTNMKDVVEQVVLNSAVLRPEIQVITDVEEVFFDGLLEAWRVAIENIMENAFRYAQTYIQITVREDDLRICNDGPKMPEDRIASLFRPYEKGEGGRFGLGLSIVSKVCRANRYRVQGYNTDDGVCFRIYRDPKKKKQLERKKKENHTKGAK